MAIYIIGYYASIRKDGVQFAAKWIELKGIMLSKQSQRKKENIICSHLSIIQTMIGQGSGGIK